jgi:hypothetical protein
MAVPSISAADQRVTGRLNSGVRPMRKFLAICGIFIVASVGCARSDIDTPVPAEAVIRQLPADWTLQHECTVDGLPALSDSDMRVMRALASECQPVGACTLACFRSGCGQGAPRNCLHVCDPLTPPSQLTAAAKSFAARSHVMCQHRPNNSFKPKPLRGSA